MMARAAKASTLVALVSLIALIITGDACHQVRSMTQHDACYSSCNNSPDWCKVCKDTLRNEPPTAEVTVFALTATRQAKRKYEDTIALMDKMLRPGASPGDVREVVNKCKGMYGVAHGLLAKVLDQLSACNISPIRQELVGVQTNINNCQNALWGYYQHLPLYSMVTADFGRTIVAVYLGVLVDGK